MIVFLDKPVMANYIIWNYNKPVVIYNLSSLYSGYKDATALMTKMNIVNTTGIPMNDFVDTVEFDIQYANTILNDPLMFTTFMDIIQCDYIGYNAIIMVQRDLYRDAVMESLIKFIQQRYGINAWIIQDEEDLDNMSESYYTPEGIIQLGKDLERYYEFCKQNIILNPVIDIDLNVE